MIVYDKVICNFSVKEFESSTLESVSNNKELESQAEEISFKIRDVIQDKNTKEIATKYVKNDQVEQLFIKFNIQNDLLGIYIMEYII